MENLTTGEFWVHQKSQKAFCSQSSVLERDYPNLLWLWRLWSLDIPTFMQNLFKMNFTLKIRYSWFISAKHPQWCYSITALNKTSTPWRIMLNKMLCTKPVHVAQFHLPYFINVILKDGKIIFLYKSPLTATRKWL